MKYTEFLLSIIIVFSSFGLYAAFTNAEIAELSNREDNNELKFRISGNFMDTNNVPIAGITATIRENTDIWAGNVSTYEKFFDTPEFIITSGLCQQLSVTFSKDGYYPINISAKGVLDYVEGQASIANENIIVSPPASVVFEPIGPITPNIFSTSVYLTMNQNGPDIELQYLQAPENLTPAWKYPKKDYIHSPSQIPSDSLYVWPIYSASGQLTGARLTITVPDSGFVFDLNDNSNNFYRKMKTAPESGYITSYTISAENFNKDIYFYIKLKDMYGKGYIDISNIKNDESATIVIYINKDKDSQDSRRINPATM